MGKRRILKKASAILCVFCILISMLANGAVVFAADDETVTEGTVIVQSGNTETNEEKPEGGGSAGGGEETQVQIPQEGNDTDQQETSDEKTETDETAASAPSAEKPDQTSSGSTDENTGESTEGATDKPADKTSADETSADETSAETSTESASESDAVSKTEPVSEKEEETVPKMRKARSAVSTNLADFLTEVMISAPQDEEGNYIINPNSTYEMTLSFNENEGVQFDDEALLTYSFPEGVTINDVGSTPFSITVKDEKGTAVVNGNTFEVVNGQLRVRFNQDDPNFDRLKVMPNVKFSIAISSSFHQTAGEIVFNENIVKDFVYEEKSDLEIQKSVVYDKENDTAHYELQIRSNGVNENVIIEDHLTGTALTFNQDVAAQSSINGTLNVTPDYASVDNGFRVTIPGTVDGEVIKLTYSAAVDNTKITYNGSVEQTNNTARVTSDQVPDGKTASADFAGQVKFHRISKTAAGDPVPAGDGLYEQTWKILVNEDHKMPVGDTDIFDWIIENSRPFMQFDGDGITVKVNFENGTSETRSISWSDLYLYKDSHGTIGWKYHTPASDGKASYEITCSTKINTSGALGNLTLVNGAQVHNSYEEGKVTVGSIGESNFGIQKEAVGTTSAESEWRITVTVPGGGLPEMHIVDDCPMLTYEGNNYIDSPQEDSFIIEGLLPGESWKLRTSSESRSFTITFYKSETQNEANKGLLSTADGKPRNIVIHYKTNVHQDWLNLAAQDGYASPALYTHRNYTCAWSGSYRTETVNAMVIPIKPNLVKSFAERSEAEIDGVTYPVFRYSLELSGPAKDGITIRDSFNTDYLKYYEAAGIQILGGVNSTPADGNGTISAANTSGGMDITVSRFPKQSDGSFYPYYQISYSLIPKDKDAFQALNAAAAASQGGIDLENTAKWGSLESERVVNYTYFPYVDKELLTKPTAGNGYIATFEVTINKYAEDLDPASDVLAIQDVLSPNLRFMPDTLTISPENDSIAVQHDDETNTLIFTEVPDETTFVITYQARVLGSGNVTYSNTVKFGNFEKTVEETAVVDSSGTGTGSNPSITIVKRDSEALSTVLAGATFQLFYLEGGERIPVRDKEGKDVTFTTGADGSALIVGNLQKLGWTLWADRTYCLVETAAPAGYKLNEEPVSFILSEHPSSQIEYDITGDRLSLKDEAVKVSIPVTKTWVGPVGADAVVVHLLADGTDTGKTITLSADGNWTGEFDNLRKFDDTGEEIWYSVAEDPMDNYVPRYDGSADTGYTITNINTETLEIPVEKRWIGPAAKSVTINLLADGKVTDSAVLNEENEWKHIFTNLPRYNRTSGQEIVYDVKEVLAEGYEQERSGSVKTGFTFTNTITGKVSIPVTKKWIGPAADSVTVELLADGVRAAKAVLNEADGWQYTFTDLDQYHNGVEIEYTIQEIRMDGYDTKITGDQSGYTITNTSTATIEIPVAKQWVGPAAKSVTLQLLADGKAADTIVLNDENEWNYVFKDLAKYDSTDGHEIVYDVQEDPVPGYTRSRSGSVETGFTFINTISGKVSIPVTKKWVGPAADKVTINLYADGVKAADIVLNKSNNWKHTFTNLAQYNRADGHEIVYTISEKPVDGYKTSITGDMHSGFTVTNTKTSTPPPAGTHTKTPAPSSAGTPKTGDKSHLLLYFAALLLSGAGLVGTILSGRKRTKRQKSK